jgi:Gluconate 2-dehydrogenase subunit 3
MTPPDDQDGNSRRSFLASTGGLITAAWLGTHWAAVAAAAHHAGNMGAAHAGAAHGGTGTDAAPPWRGYEFLSATEAQDTDAIAAQIVPGGPTPGAREAHAVYFIDRALATFFAAWAGDFRAGLGDFQSKFHAAHPAEDSFAKSSDATQLAYLETVDRTPFFETVRTLTLLGMVSAPKYGGNVDGAGWKMMGFEDRHAFTPPFGYYDARYTGFVPYPVKPA